ncbi:LytR/AlgR family response regulator transcription factor [Alteromonas gilva]|uniref:LytTR family DNA-binding domain-containing protein n=1 Tax=Alteromonas gilva TaxID=2987522 RepID=A0ABT5L5X7_9ALTE|nr:LytTR family DNA-binding domain-containing protein [Alteromonas gilva]MDC8832450.1 LytTR family DNA-binding domain-containing protein [Alteromonas gilva]
MSHSTSVIHSITRRIDRHPQRYALLAIAFYLFLNNTVNATSTWMESTRHGETSLSMWEPFVWEYSSALSTLLCLLPLFWFWRRYPLRFARPGKQLAMHLLASLVFSVCHVVLMVGMRELVYSGVGGDYNFGPWLREFVYEYRKDLLGYVNFLVLFQLCRFAYSRIKGEANFIGENAPNRDAAGLNDVSHNHSSAPPEHLLVKKLDKEFLVNVADIEWMESSGNYVNLHAAGSVYPLRSTLSKLTDTLAERGFIRVHRSYAVNRHKITSVSYNNSGDGDVMLSNGRQVNLSRRYKDKLKQYWSEG